MERTKATFKALRETVGLSQDNIAELCGVTVTSVKRWERPGRQEPPAGAWQVLEEYRRAHIDAVDAALDQLEELEKLTGEKAPVTLTYWRTQAQYDDRGRDEGFVGVVNARSREVASVAEGNGWEVSFAFPDDGAIVTEGSRY